MIDIQCHFCKSYLNIREVVTRCTECKELIFKPKTNNMKNNFKGKDRVYFEPYGWGTIVVINNTIAIINFDILSDSINIISDFYPLLSFTEYTLQGFTQERPFTPEVGEYYYFWNEETKNDDCVGYGRLKQISNNINFPYFFGTKYFQFCSETNPLL
jgi:hypothetical protein